MKLLIFVFCVSLIQRDASCAMTEAQVKSATGLLRKVCQPKTKITNDQIEEFHTGTFNKSPEVLNYMECILRSGQIMKDGKLTAEDVIMKQLKNLPPGLSEKVIAGYEHCKGVEGGDKFELAFEFIKCLYDFDPESFFLP